MNVVTPMTYLSVLEYYKWVAETRVIIAVHSRCHFNQITFR
jgi:hypothetical protein